ncbi:MAG: tRNA 5-methoxyuridine(34)/uridine 5-oxyacetic acid(34) synthase CmoB [Mariprofundales bacterium]|nr:tRNA 5-methoxyuridine(34)/uridine 5-oxyacetic acid(34) synthase CmoB [Mariprofundales bacterium]
MGAQPHPAPPPHDAVVTSPLADHQQHIEQLVNAGWSRVMKHGDYPRWQQAVAALPTLTDSMVTLDSATVTIKPPAITERASQQLRHCLQELIPWRKGPFRIADTTIDCEWRSDLKWERIVNHITPLTGRTVLDVGCGSGYHCWRMRGAGAAAVIGIDPTALFVMQFQAIQHFIQDRQVQLWPLGIDELPDSMGCFDTIFSMGLLYHRRSPLDHLTQLKRLLRPDGELVLESLVIDGGESCCLTPQERYAKMRNVWFIPSVQLLTIWMQRCGWRNIRLIDCTTTTTREQRSTPWMPYESLRHYLNPDNPSQTIEGYPAPKRATLLAQR